MVANQILQTHSPCLLIVENCGALSGHSKVFTEYFTGRLGQKRLREVKIGLKETPFSHAPTSSVVNSVPLTAAEIGNAEQLPQCTHEELRGSRRGKERFCQLPPRKFSTSAKAEIWCALEQMQPKECYKVDIERHSRITFENDWFFTLDRHH